MLTLLILTFLVSSCALIESEASDAGVDAPPAAGEEVSTTEIPEAEQEVAVDTSRPELLIPTEAVLPAAVDPVVEEVVEEVAEEDVVAAGVLPFEGTEPEDLALVEEDRVDEEPAEDLVDEDGVDEDLVDEEPVDELVEEEPNDDEDAASTAALPSAAADAANTETAPTETLEAVVALAPKYEDPWVTLAQALQTAAWLDPGTETAASSAGVTDDSIVIEGLVSQTLVGKQINEGVCAGAEARFAEANALGELSREIDFGMCHDDAAQVAIADGIARSIASSDVFAVTPISSPAFLAGETLNQAHVPYVGRGDLPVFCGSASSYGFGVNGAPGCPILPARGFLVLTAPVLTAWVATQESAAALSTVVHVIEDSIAGYDTQVARAYEAQLLELNMVTLPLAPPSSASPMVAWSRLAREIMEEKPTAVLLEAETALPLVPALRAEGFRGEIAWVGIVDPLELASSEYRGTLAPLTVITPGLDLSATNSATWERMQAAAELIGFTGTNEPTLPDGLEGEVADDGEPTLAQQAEDARATQEARDAAEAALEAGEEIVAAPDDENPAEEAAGDQNTAEEPVVVASEDSRVVGAGFVEGYLAADFLVRGLAATPEPLTSEAFHQTLNGGWWYPGLDDVACGGWWPAGHYLDVPCVSVSRVEAFSNDLVSVLGLREVAPRWQGNLGG